MTYGILDFISLIGALGFFIYGMKIMSDGIQKVAGSKLRQILASMTSNRFFGVLTGFIITCLIQSSSATTVMVVSFVNAGLLSLIESIGVIMGANIGTTITAWLISIFGFKVKIADFSLLIIAFSFPLLFTKNSNLKNLAEVFIGFALLFMGLDALKNSVPDLRSHPEALEFLKGFSYEDKSYLGKISTTILFVFIGTILTIVVQSSSAAMALTLVMTNQGWIPFPLAASMVLGENIGTTITANLAALVANTNAKRAARAHFIFNVFGVIWMILFIPFFVSGIDFYMTKNDMGSPMNNPLSVPIGLSIFHSVFNVLNVLFLIWFARFIAKTVVKLVKDKKELDEDKLPIHLKDSLDKNPEQKLNNVKKELLEFADEVIRSLNFLRKYLVNINEDSKSVEKHKLEIYKSGKTTNIFHKNISEYLTIVSLEELKEAEGKLLHKYLEISNEMENFSDLIVAMTQEIEQNRNNSVTLMRAEKESLDSLLKHINNSFNDFKQLLENDFQEGEIQRIKEGDYLHDIFIKLKNENLETLLKQEKDFQQEVYYSRLHNMVEQIYYRLRSMHYLADQKYIK